VRTIFEVALVVGVLLTPCSAYAQAPITTQNYFGRLDADGILTRTKVTMESFHCGDYKEKPTPKEIGRKACIGNLKFSKAAGISIILITEQTTDVVVYAAAGMMSPGFLSLKQSDAVEMFGHFTLMMQVMMAAFSPGYTNAKRAAVGAEVIKGRMKKVNDAQLGKWVYSAGDGMGIVFTVQRVDDRIVTAE
jgi:hypothetical protein